MVVLWLRVGTADAEVDVEELAGFDEDVDDETGRDELLELDVDDETGCDELLELEDDDTELA
jgi:hypothetical protein